MSLDELSELVMRKVALRFGLDAHRFECEETLLSSIQRGECPLVVLDAEVFGTSNDHIDAEIRSFCPELPVAVLSNRLPPHALSRYLLRGGQLTLINKPVQFGFERLRRADFQLN
ncbi:MAG: hypothetical protein ACI9DF_002586 [Verrucomicrobiales bacterium]